MHRISLSLFLLQFVLLGSCVYSFPDQGKWEFSLPQGQLSIVAVMQSLYKDSRIFIKVSCLESKSNEVVIQWMIYQMTCWDELSQFDQQMLQSSGRDVLTITSRPNETLPHCKSLPERIECADDNVLPPLTNECLVKLQGNTGSISADVRSSEPVDLNMDSPEQLNPTTKIHGRQERQVSGFPKTEPVKEEHSSISGPSKVSPQFITPVDGIFRVLISVNAPDGDGLNFSATISVEMKGPYGYLSAVDWPLLPFYGVMCFIYVVYGVIWLVVSFCQWREILRIQFWIGGVIFLGMLEKAVFYAEYQSINSTGVSVQGAVLFAEIVSCAKRTLARMLVIIVSLGFGIVKPRLGPLLHRVVGVGALYFILSVIEGCLRVLKPKNDPSNQVFIASIPLAVLDSAICWWIFSSLVQTMRTLRLRRNVVKLSLYRHFTNTLIFAILASVAFMLWSLKYHKFAPCLTDWKELWVDNAYWHLLFSVILLVIMILWRPTNNNQRYAFTPLLDAADDEDDEEQLTNDAFEGMKVRQVKGQSTPSPKSRTSVDEDLKWVEENIPSSVAETALPIMDSDEEIMNTKFEMSKME